MLQQDGENQTTNRYEQNNIITLRN